MALALLGWALVESLQAEPAARGAVTGVPTPAVLAAWTAGPMPSQAHALVADPPAPVERDWLAALGRSGTRVTWSNDSLVPLAATVEPVATPGGAYRVRIAGPRGVEVRLADAAGLIDTVLVVNAGAAIDARTLAGDVNAAVRGRGAVAGVDRGVLVHDALVLGSAGWEARFLILALEESGWRVTARLAVAPDTWVEQGTLTAIDTARFSVVVVLDTAVGRWGDAIAAYARRGGGVVLAGRAAAHRSLRAIAPGRPAAYLPSDAGTPPDSAPRSALGVHPVATLTPDALVLERRGPLVTAAARRLGLGRVVQVGHDETWRWRMGGGDDAPRRHREWWSRVLTSVAYAPSVPDRRGTAPDSTDAAPFVHLVDALGEPQDATETLGASTASLPAWMLALAGVLLLFSWGARRLRGAP